MAVNKWHGYWQTMGKTYAARFRENAIYQAQERMLRDQLRTIHFDSVLEIGCGFGRMTKIIWSFEPRRYLAIDVSPDQVAIASDRVPGPEYRIVPVEDLVVDEQFDLVFASEVLMHIPPESIESVVESMFAWSRRHVITIDLARPNGLKLASHNWAHDYHHLYRKYVTSDHPVKDTVQSMFHVDKEL